MDCLYTSMFDNSDSNRILDNAIFIVSAVYRANKGQKTTFQGFNGLYMGQVRALFTPVSLTFVRVHGRPGPIRPKTVIETQ